LLVALNSIAALLAGLSAPAAAQAGGGQTTVTGTITLGGVPLANASLDANVSEGPVETDANGNYSLTYVGSPDDLFVLNVSTEETDELPLIDYRPHEIDASDGIVDIDIPFELTQLTVNIVDEQNNPVDTDFIVGDFVFLSTASNRWLSSGETVNGSLTVPALTAPALSLGGSVTVSNANYFGSGLWDATTDTLTLTVSPKTLVSGTLTFDGTPVAGATITDTDDFINSTQTDANGNYSLPVEDPDSTQFFVTPLSDEFPIIHYFADRAGVRSGRLDIDIPHQVTDLTINLIDSNGDPFDEAIQISDSQGDTSWTNFGTTVNGTVTLPRLDTAGPIELFPVGFLGAAVELPAGIPSVTIMVGLGDPTVVAPTLCEGELITVDIAAGDTPTEGDDVILGTDGPDVINAGAGADIICAGSGNDIINGGNGKDTIFGGAGDDTINAGQGLDTVYGNSGDDFISGGKGKDVLNGGAGNDDIRGNEGTDTIIGGNGDDELRGGQKADTINGGNGDDNLVGGTRPDILDGGQGRDTYNGGGGNDLCTPDANGLQEIRVRCER